MGVDLNSGDLDLRRPDPNYKSDPSARGDEVKAGAADETDETEEEATGEGSEASEEENEPKKEAKKSSKKDVKAKAEDEESEEEEESEDEDDDDRKKSQAVPYSRFKKTRQQVKELTTRLAETQARLDAVKETQTQTETKEFEKRQTRIEELYEQIEEKRALGESKEAGKLQRELDSLRDDMSRAETRRMTLEAAVRSQQVSVFNTTLSQIEAVFPELVQDADEFDEDLVGDLEETIKGYEKLGYSMVEALQRASKRILRYDPMARGKSAFLKGFSGKVPGEKADVAEPEKKAAPELKRTDIKKNVEASKKQPVDPADDTNDIQAKLDMKKVKPDDYKALPESVRRKLRGDSVAV